jgi:hypothetical protein
MGEDLGALNDPDFPVERKRVRETIEALTERLAALGEEFIRHASAEGCYGVPASLARIHGYGSRSGLRPARRRWRISRSGSPAT